MSYALVSGAGSGIGRATVERLHADGYPVIAVDIARPDAALAKQWREQGIAFLALDVGNRDALLPAITELSESRAISTLINCAGISSYGHATDIKPAEWQRVMNINLNGSLWLCQALLPDMLARRQGCIVNVASIFGLQACDNNLAYNVAKGGIVQLTRSLAADYAHCGIRSNAVAPGLIETPMTAAIKHAPDTHQKFIDWHLQGRAGRAEEVAAAIAFLCSADASFVNGQILAVDGGFSAGRRFGSTS